MNKFLYKITVFLLLFIFTIGTVFIPSPKSLVLAQIDVGSIPGIAGPLDGANASCLGIIPGAEQISNIFNFSGATGGLSGLAGNIPIIGGLTAGIPGIGGGTSHVPTFDVELNPTFKNYSAQQLGFKSREEQKERCLDKIAWQAAKFLIRQIVDDLANWLRGGAYGKPRFITDFDAYLKDAADNAGGLLLEEILGVENAQLLCEPWRFQIVLDIFNPRNWRDDYGLRAQCKISDILRAAQGGAGIDLSINESAPIYNFYNDFSQGGWPAFLTMSLDDGSNPIGSYLMTLEEKEQRIAYETEKRKLEANVNKGLLIGACVDKRVSSITGREFCLRTEMTSPGVAIEGALETAFGSEIRQLELADEINELIAAAITGIKTRLLWNQGIAESKYRGGLGSGWISDWELRNRLGAGVIDPTSDEALSIWQPIEFTNKMMVYETDKYILTAQNFLEIKKKSLELLTSLLEPPGETDIDKLAAIDSNLQTTKDEMINWQITIKKSVQTTEAITYDKGRDPVSGYKDAAGKRIDLLARHPDWNQNTNRGANDRAALCEEAKTDFSDDFSEAKYLAGLKLWIICADDNALLNEIQNQHINKLPELDIDGAAALKEYSDVQATQSEQKTWLESYNLNLGAAILKKPDSGTNVKEGGAQFSWEPVKDAASYQFQIIDADNTLTNFSATTTEFILIQKEFDKLAAGEYFWRAAGIDASNKLGKYSEKRKFEVEK